MKTPASRFTSPLRGPWLTSVFGLALLVALPIIILTGLLSYVAYGPQLGQAIPADVGWLRLPLFTWPTRPSWLYRLTQGLHVGLGLVIIPVVLAKLWSVIPKLFAWPPARSLAQLIERVSLLMLVGGVLFEIVTGVLNIQYDYIFGFSFYDAHCFGAWVLIIGFLMHIALKIPHMVTGLRSLSWRELFTRYYGAHPLHLLTMVAGFALLGYVLIALRPAALWNPDKWWQSVAVWFAAAVIAHDLVLFPLYALADAALGRLPRRHQRSPKVPVLNYIRVPALGAALTLLVFLPGIIEQGAATYQAATGQTQQPFLGRWLLLVAAMFAGSAVAYAVRLIRAHRLTQESA